MRNVTSAETKTIYLVLFLPMLLLVIWTSFGSIQTHQNNNHITLSILGNIWNDVITFFKSMLRFSLSPSSTTSTVPSSTSIIAPSTKNSTSITTTSTSTINQPIKIVQQINTSNMTKSATLTNSTVIEYVNITNVTLIFHNLNSGLNYTSIYGTRGGYALSLNAGTMMNGGQGYQLNSNQTIISVEYKTGGFVPEGTGFMVWLDRYIGLNNNGTSILGLRFKAPNYAYTGPLDVIVNYVDGESTTPISTTTIPYSYLSHPICSPTNNTFYSYPDNITCAPMPDGSEVIVNERFKGGDWGVAHMAISVMLLLRVIVIFCELPE